jgi:hypothetical protein
MLRFSLVLCAIALVACGSRSEGLLFVPDADGGAGVGGSPGGFGGSPVGPGGSGNQGGSGGVVDNQIISLGPESLLEAEVSLAVSPTGLVAAAWIGTDQFGFPAVAYAFSENDGVDWLDPVRAPTAPGLASGDPVLALAEDGGFYLTWLGVDPGFMVDELYVSRALPGETTFADPVVVDGPSMTEFLDKPWITVTNKGTVILTYASFGNPDFSLRVARSTDQAQTFSIDTLTTSPGASAFNLAFPCGARAGDDVWVVYLEVTVNGIHPRVAHSSDDGVTFPADILFANEPDVAFSDPNCADGVDGLWVSYALSNDTPTEQSSAIDHAVRVRQSTDLGASFGDPIDVLLPPRSPLAMLPNMAINEAGDTFIAYYAGSFDEDPRGTFRRSRMLQGTRSFDENVFVHAPLTFRSSREHPGWLGDYTGVVARGDKIYLAFAENSMGSSHIAFHRSFVP